jgi:hypothetical protein
MMERPLCPRGFVARPLNSELQGAIMVSLASRDFVGCCQGQLNLLRRKHFE